MTYDPAHRVVRESEIRDGGAAKTLEYAWSPGGLLDMMHDGEGH